MATTDVIDLGEIGPIKEATDTIDLGEIKESPAETIELGEVKTEPAPAPKPTPAAEPAPTEPPKTMPQPDLLPVQSAAGSAAEAASQTSAQVITAVGGAPTRTAAKLIPTLTGNDPRYQQMGLDELKQKRTANEAQLRQFMGSKSQGASTKPLRDYLTLGEKAYVYANPIADVKETQRIWREADARQKASQFSIEDQKRIDDLQAEIKQQYQDEAIKERDLQIARDIQSGAVEFTTDLGNWFAVKEDAPKAAKILGEATDGLLLATAVGLATRSPMAVSAVFGYDTALSVYDQALQSGATPEEANLQALLAGAWDTGSFLIPVSTVFGNTGKSFSTRVLQGGGSGALSGALVMAGHALIEKHGPVKGAELWRQYAESVLVMGLMGAMGGAMHGKPPEPDAILKQTPEQRAKTDSFLISAGVDTPTRVKILSKNTYAEREAAFNEWQDAQRQKAQLPVSPLAEPPQQIPSLERKVSEPVDASQPPPAINPTETGQPTVQETTLTPPKLEPSASQAAKLTESPPEPSPLRPTPDLAEGAIPVESKTPEQNAKIAKPTPETPKPPIEPTPPRTRPQQLIQEYREVHDRFFEKTEEGDFEPAPRPDTVTGKAAEAIAKVFGKEVFWVKRGENNTRNVRMGATYSADGKTIILSTETSTLPQILAVHETTHTMKDDNPEAYSRLVWTVRENLKDGAYASFRERLLKKYMTAEERATYGKAEPEAQRTQLDALEKKIGAQDLVMDEIVSETVGIQGANTKFWRELAAKDRNTFQVAADAVAMTWAKIRDAFKKNPQDEEIKALYTSFKPVYEASKIAIQEIAVPKTAADTPESTPRTPESTIAPVKPKPRRELTPEETASRLEAISRRRQMSERQKREMDYENPAETEVRTFAMGRIDIKPGDYDYNTLRGEFGLPEKWFVKDSERRREGGRVGVKWDEVLTRAKDRGVVPQDAPDTVDTLIEYLNKEPPRNRDVRMREEREWQMRQAEWESQKQADKAIDKKVKAKAGKLDDTFNPEEFSRFEPDPMPKRTDYATEAEFNEAMKRHYEYDDGALPATEPDTRRPAAEPDRLDDREIESKSRLQHKYAKWVQESPKFSDEVRSAMGDETYNRTSNDASIKEVNDYIARRGIMNAYDMFDNPREPLTTKQRVAIGITISEVLRTEAANTESPREAREYAQILNDVIHRLADLNLDVGQALQVNRIRNRALATREGAVQLIMDMERRQAKIFDSEEQQKIRKDADIIRETAHDEAATSEAIQNKVKELEKRVAELEMQDKAVLRLGEEHVRKNLEFYKRATVQRITDHSAALNWFKKAGATRTEGESKARPFAEEAKAEAMPDDVFVQLVQEATESRHDEVISRGSKFSETEARLNWNKKARDMYGEGVMEYVNDIWAKAIRNHQAITEQTKRRPMTRTRPEKPATKQEIIPEIIDHLNNLKIEGESGKKPQTNLTPDERKRWDDVYEAWIKSEDTDLARFGLEQNLSDAEIVALESRLASERKWVSAKAEYIADSLVGRDQQERKQKQDFETAQQREADIKRIGLIRKGFKDLGLTIRDVFKMNVDDKKEVYRIVKERIMDATGLSERDAGSLAFLYDQVFNDTIDKYAAKLTESATRRQHRTAAQEIIAALKRYDYDHEFARRAFAKAYGMKEVTPELILKMQGLADQLKRAERIGDPIEKERVVNEMNKVVASQAQSSLMAVHWSIMVGNMLMGPLTHGKNVLATGARTIGTLAGTTISQTAKAAANIHHPQEAMASLALIAKIYETYGKAIRYGWAQAGHIMATGDTPYDTAGKGEPDYKGISLTETHPLFGNYTGNNVAKKAVSTAFAVHKYALRALRAEDVLFRVPISEVVSMLEMAKIQRESGFTGTALAIEAGKRLGYLNKKSNADYMKFAAEAEALGYGMTPKSRWLGEKDLYIIKKLQEQRPPDIRETAANISLQETFNKKNPTGLPGVIHEMAQSLVKKTNPKENTLGGFAAKYLTLFTRITANVANYAVDTTPILGQIRLAREYMGKGHYEGGKHGVMHTESERQLLRDRVVMGTLATAGIMSYVLLKSLQEERDGKKPAMVFHGPGPKNPALRKQQKTRPWTVEFSDGTVINMTYLGPLAPAAALAGATRDYLMYEHKNTVNLEGELIDDIGENAKIVAAIGSTMTSYMANQFPAKGMTDVTSLFQTGNFTDFEGKIKTMASNLVRTQVPNLWTQLDNIYDPTVRSAKGFDWYDWRNLARTLPIARRKYLAPMRTLFGDEAQYQNQIIGKPKTDPQIEYLTRNRIPIMIPDPKAIQILQKDGKDNPAGNRPASQQEADDYYVAFGKILRPYIAAMEAADKTGQFISPDVSQTIRNKQLADWTRKIVKEAKNNARVELARTKHMTYIVGKEEVAKFKEMNDVINELRAYKANKK